MKKKIAVVLMFSLLMNVLPVSAEEVLEDDTNIEIEEVVEEQEETIDFDEPQEEIEDTENTEDIENTDDTDTVDLFAELEERNIDSGWYSIHMSNNMDFCLDITNFSENEGADLQLYKDSGNLAQRFYIVEKENGWYTIQSVSSNKFIGVSDTESNSGTKLHQWSSSGIETQEFKFYQDEDGAMILRSHAGENLVCDITAGKIANGSKAQIYRYNGTAAQKFTLKSWKMPGQEEKIENAIYRIYPSAAYNVSLDVAGGSVKYGANVQLYTKNWTAAQEWKIVKENSWYRIINAKSNMVLDVKGGSSSPRANLQQWTKNAGRGQLYRFYKKGDNQYCLMSKLGTVIDCTGGSLTKGTNVQMYTANGTPAQTWSLEKVVVTEKPEKNIVEDDYILNSGLGSNLVLDVQSASKSSGGNIQVYTSNNSLAQSFHIKKESDGWYTIQNNYSGLYLDVKSGSNIPGTNLQQYGYNGTDAQKFKFYDNGSGKVYIQSKLGTMIDVSGGKSKAGTNIHMYTYNGSNAQVWSLKKAHLLDVAKTCTQYITVSVYNGNYATVAMNTLNGTTWKQNFSVAGRVGAQGIGKTKEGDKKTPTGVYSLYQPFGIKSNPGCKLGYTKVNKNHYWGGQDAKYYNKLVDASKVSGYKPGNAEHLINYGSVYNYCVAVGYNPDCVVGKGSAIFLHCKGSGATAGCISIPEKDMITVLKNLRNDAKIIIDYSGNINRY